jgi:hypothetical protein
VPYVVVAQAGDSDPVVENWKAGESFVQLDVDDDKSTGKGGGGKDVKVGVTTELLPTPHLNLEIERLGEDSFVEDLEVLIAFPFDAFTDEVLPGAPNLFIGYQTTAADGAVGGHAPLLASIDFTTGVLAGTDHAFEIDISTEGADNPLQFITGHFDGDNLVGTLNAAAISAHVETATHSVPETISIGLDVGESFPLGGAIETALGVSWEASETAVVRFEYLEEESDPENADDFTTAITVDEMPVDEELTLSLSSNPGFTLSHRGSSVIDAITLERTRADGLTILGTATDVPTEVDVTFDLDATAVLLDVNDNTLDLKIEVLKEGGFLDTSDALGFDIGYLSVGVEDAPDLTAGYSADSNTYSAAATNDGEFIGAVEVVGDDDAAYDEFGVLQGLNLAPSWEDVPTHHIFSLFDDPDDEGVHHGTAAARVLFIDEAELNLSSDEISEQLHLVTAQAAPLQGHLDLREGSTVIPGITVPEEGVLVTCDIDDVPAGTFDYHYRAPIDFGYTTDPASSIDSVHCFGHIGKLNFDIDVGDLPAIFAFAFEADGRLAVRAENGTGPNSAMVGHVAARLWSEDGLPGTEGLLGTILKDARARVDDIPSSHATWTVAQNVAYDGGSGGLPSVGDVVYDVTSGATGIVLAADSSAAAGTHTVGFIKDGSFSDGDALDVLDRLAYENGPSGFEVGDTVTGETSGASGVVQRTEALGDSGTLFLSGVSGTFQDGENLQVDGDTQAEAQGAQQTAASWAANVDGAPTQSGTLVDFDTDATDVFLGGVQFAVSTQIELVDPLPEAAPDSEHFAALEEEGSPPSVQRLKAGAFSIDEFHLDTLSSINLHYDANAPHALVAEVDRSFDGAFFPDAFNFDVDLVLTVDAVPQSFDFSSDLMTSFHYDASDEIASITLIGVVDDTDDATENGTNVEFIFLGLPSEVRFGVTAGAIAVINGRLDVDADGGIDGDDDGEVAGFTVLDGRVDLDRDGNVDGDDDGTLHGVRVLDGELDVDDDGGVDGDDDRALAGATLLMNDSIDLISLHLDSDNDIFGSGFRLIEASVTEDVGAGNPALPAQWFVNWAGGGFLLEAKDAFGNPQPMGVLAGRISTSNDPVQNDMKLEPFTLNGPIAPGSDPILDGSDGSRVNYSPFLQEIDKRYYDASGAPSVFDRLRDLYAGSEELDAGEDHAIVRLAGSGSLDFASFQFTGFQRISWVPDTNGGQFIFRAPSPGLHPLFGGFEQGGVFTTLQIENIPDEIVVDIDKTGAILYDAMDDVDPSAGQIDVYRGPLPVASDTADAIRVIMNDTPAFVHLTWNFGFPSGGVNFDASNEFEILFLAQDGANRITAGLQMEDLQLGYNVEFFTFNVAEEFEFGICPVCATLPTAWDLVRATAGIDNDADGPGIGANFGKPGVDGFFALYKRIAPSPLVPAGPAAGAQEYVPLVTALMKDFRELSVSAGITLDPFSPNLFFPISIDVPPPTLHGDFVIDFWSSANTDATFGINFLDIVDITVGFRNVPDYTDNTPIHLVPLDGIIITNVESFVYTLTGFHNFGSHVDPFMALHAPHITGTAGISRVLTLEDLDAVASEALGYWSERGIDAKRLAALAEVDFRIVDLPGATLAMASPEVIWIDRNAAEHGWFTDVTLADPHGFQGMDLLSVLIHEQGHLLGFEHGGADFVMGAILEPGVRRLETRHAAAELEEGFFELRSGDTSMIEGPATTATVTTARVGIPIASHSTFDARRVTPTPLTPLREADWVMPRSSVPQPATAFLESRHSPAIPDAYAAALPERPTASTPYAVRVLATEAGAVETRGADAPMAPGDTMSDGAVLNGSDGWELRVLYREGEADAGATSDDAGTEGWNRELIALQVGVGATAYAKVARDKLFSSTLLGSRRGKDRSPR